VNKKQFRSFLILFLFGLLQFSYSQDRNETIDLRQYLNQIEKEFSVQFSYADKTLEKVTILPLDETPNLETLLLYLEEQTNLKFTQLSKRFITVEVNTSESVEQAAIQHLDEVFIENYLTKGISETYDGRYTFHPQKYGLIPGMIEPDLFQAVLALPGVQSVDERISNINIRGGTNDENLILYEGIRMYQTGHFFGLISAFNPYLTETVNTQKNGTTAKYGEGVSGVMVIENSDAISESFSGGLGLNFLAADAYVNTAISENFGLQLSARRSLTDLVNTPTYEAYFKRVFEDSELNNISREASINFAEESFSFNDITAKLLWNIDARQTLRANFISIYNNLDYSEAITTEQLNSIETQSSLKQSSMAGSMEYSREWSNSFQTTIQLMVSGYELDAVSSNLTSNQTLVQENVVLDYGFRVENIFKWNSNWSSNIGYQLSEIGVSNLEDVNQPRFRSFIKEVVRTHSIYGDVSYRSNNRGTLITGGIRTNYINKLDVLRIEPRFNLSQRLFEDLQLKLQAELKSQSLTQIIDLQQDFLGIEKRRWQLADGNNIPLVTSQQIGAGLSYSKSGWLAEADVYFKQVDGISSRTQGFQNQFQFVNDIGSYSIRGFEFLLNKQFKRLSTWMSYTFSENNYKFNTLFDNRTFPNNIDVRHNLNASSVYLGEHWKVGLGLNWNSGRPYTAPANEQDTGNTVIEFDSPNAERLPNYLRLDASANYEIRLSSEVIGEFGVSLWNLNNRRNIVNRFYILDNDNAIVEVNNRGLGFTPNFSFRIYF
jgi:hypothetical protein